MITITPEATWSDLAEMIAGAGSDGELAAPWRRRGERAFLLSRSAWAMQAIALWWRRHRDAAPCFWLPDYFCNQSVAPLREIEAELVFYPVGTDLNPRWADCVALAETARPDLFVLVHYFGIPGDAARARRLCGKTGALLIEDAAHVQLPLPGIGEASDFTFYSPPKLAAVPDGSVLLMRGDNAAQDLMASVVNEMTTRAASARLWLAKQAIRKTMPAVLLPDASSRGTRAFDDDSVGTIAPTPGLSSAGRSGLTRLPRALAAIAARRNENAIRLSEVLVRDKGWKPIIAATDFNAPYRLVMRCDDQMTAAQRFETYRSRGCPVESWPDLAPEVAAEPDRHAGAIRLRQTLLLFPVHQSIKIDELIHRCRF